MRLFLTIGGWILSLFALAVALLFGFFWIGSRIPSGLASVLLVATAGLLINPLAWRRMPTKSGLVKGGVVAAALAGGMAFFMVALEQTFGSMSASGPRKLDPDAADVVATPRPAPPGDAN